MANTFKSITKANVGTVTTDVYTVAASTTSVIIGLILSNKTGDQITADVFLNKSNVASDDVYLIKNLLIPNGSSFEYISGSKLILETGDKIQILSNTVSSLDVTVSVLEQT
jgi:hypothetical protein